MKQKIITRVIRKGKSKIDSKFEQNNKPSLTYFLSFVQFFLS